MFQTCIKRISTSMLLIFMITAMIFSLPASSAKEDAPITSTWKFYAIKSEDGVSRASEIDEDPPGFECDGDLNITFYLNGKFHPGTATLSDDGSYLLNYEDSDNSMTAVVKGDELTVTVGGDSDIEIIFKAQ